MTRIQGSGTVVAQLNRITSRLAFRDIHDEILERGHQHSARVVLTESLRANASLAQTLKLRAGSRVFHSVLVHCEDGVPIQFEDRLVNPAAAPDYLTVDFEQTTPTHYLLEKAPLTEASYSIEAGLPTAQEAGCLGLGAGEPCLVMTRCTVSGPFSRFDGVQRWFAVLGGAGVALTHNGQRHALTVGSPPFCFDGGAPTGCELMEGPTQDFNLMTRVAGDGFEVGVADEARAGATMARVRGSASIHVSALSNTIKIVAIYALPTRATAIFNGENTSIEPYSLVWRIVAAHDDIQLDAEDALLIEMEVQPKGAIHVSPGAPTHAPNDSESTS